jgi:hypothetical protein
MFLNDVVIVMDDAKVIAGAITGTFNELGGGIYVQPAGGEQPQTVKFSAMTSMTVVA